MMKLPLALTFLASITVASITVVGAAMAAPVSVVSCDRQVTFDAPPARAVSNDVNLTEMMLVLGLQDRMVGYSGISGWKTLDPVIRDGVGQLPELSRGYATREVLIGADADFYFAGWNYGLKVGGEVTPQSLAPFGIQVYELRESCIHVMDKPPASMDDLYTDIRNLGIIFDVSDRAEALISRWQQQLAEISASLTRDGAPVRVFVYDSGEDAPFTAGRYAMPNAMITAAGGVNIMEDVQKSWARVTWEPVVERNPEVIVIINYGDVTAEQKRRFIRNNPAFADIDAVKNDRFVVLEYVEATPGPRNIAAIAKLAAALRAD